MAELEIHHETEHEKDPFGKAMGVLAAVFAMLLAIVSIASHRAHTEAVLLKTDANDKWSYYQAQRMKYHNLELGEDLLSSINGPTPDTAKRLDHYKKDKVKYDERSKKAQEDAEGVEKKSEVIENKALRLDFGEGLLEIAVVMTSLYFISKNKLFPVVGGIAAAIGIVLGALGLFF
jgi:Domain of unknown function (DUF4337)